MITQRVVGIAALVLATGGAVALGGCDTGPAVTPAITPGTASHPRAVVIVAKDYAFIPPIVDLVPGETVVFQVINGGLIAHEAVIGSPQLQLAWESAEAPTASAPPGPTPAVSIAPAVAATGLRVFVGSGQRADVTWQVPLDAASGTGGAAEWLVACHIPGHLAAGMLVPIRFVGPGGVPLGSPPAAASVVP